MEQKTVESFSWAYKKGVASLKRILYFEVRQNLYNQ